MRWTMLLAVPAVICAPDGCAIATWTRTDVDASWDGGHTFTDLPLERSPALVAISARRVVVWSGDDAIGVAVPGEPLVGRSCRA